MIHYYISEIQVTSQVLKEIYKKKHKTEEKKMEIHRYFIYFINKFKLSLF